jgi:hypothetical protein
MNDALNSSLWTAIASKDDISNERSCAIFDADSLFELRPMAAPIPLTLLSTSMASDEACIEHESFVLLRVTSDSNSF